MRLVQMLFFFGEIFPGGFEQQRAIIFDVVARRVTRRLAGRLAKDSGELFF
jgi:hypothetical protein